MASTSKDEQRRQRLHDYDAELAVARSALAVLMQFVQGREARGGGGLIEEEFAATPVPDAESLPASVWVTLRQGDLDATLDALVRLSTTQFMVGEHEELDSTYKLTTIEEHRSLPELNRLQRQLADFLRVPFDVVSAITSWGPDDPRTGAEVDSLLAQRFGPARGQAGAETEPVRSGRHQVADDAAGLLMSSEEFIALLHLSPGQSDSLMTLVRQTRITITSH